MSTEDSLTTAELAKRWKMNAITLRKWRSDGIGPRFFKPGGPRGAVRYRLSDIIAWEEKHSRHQPDQ